MTRMTFEIVEKVVNFQLKIIALSKVVEEQQKQIQKFNAQFKKGQGRHLYHGPTAFFPLFQIN